MCLSVYSSLLSIDLAVDGAARRDGRTSKGLATCFVNRLERSADVLCSRFDKQLGLKCKRERRDESSSEFSAAYRDSPRTI